MRILLVEDEARMSAAIKRGLRQAAYAVDVARDGEDALYQASINDYDAIILDVMLPKRNGFRGLPRTARAGVTHPRPDAHSARRSRGSDRWPGHRGGRLSDEAF